MYKEKGDRIEMTELEHLFVAFILAVGIFTFTFPFLGGPATATVVPGIQLGVALAWIATLAIPLLIVAHQFTASGGGS